MHKPAQVELQLDRPQLPYSKILGPTGGSPAHYRRRQPNPTRKGPYKYQYFKEVALQGSRQLPAMAEMAPSDISIAPLNLASLSSPSSLANSCTFLVGVWRIIKDLARSALATVPGRRRRILFLVRLKNRKISNHHFLCLSCNAHDLGSIFSSRN